MSQPDFTIRPMASAEAFELSSLIAEVVSTLTYYNDAARRSEIEKYSASSLLEYIEEDADSVLIALSDEKIIGFCLTYYDDGLIWLSWIGVHSDFRRYGIAQKLLLEMEKTVRKRGAHKIWCDCRTVNEPSKKLLTELGYRKICTVENHWYGQDFIPWEKPVL